MRFSGSGVRDLEAERLSAVESRPRYRRGVCRGSVSVSRCGMARAKREKEHPQDRDDCVFYLV